MLCPQWQTLPTRRRSLQQVRKLSIVCLPDSGLFRFGLDCVGRKQLGREDQRLISSAFLRGKVLFSLLEAPSVETILVYPPLEVMPTPLAQMGQLWLALLMWLIHLSNPLQEICCTFHRMLEPYS